MFRSRFAAIVAALSLTFVFGGASACKTAAPTQTTVAGRSAEQGLKAAQAIGGFQEAVGVVGKTIEKQEVKEAAIKALDKADQATMKMKEAIPILRAIDAAEHIGSADVGKFEQVRAILDQADLLVSLAGGSLDQYPEAAEAVKAAQEAIKLIGTVQFELGKRAPAETPVQ